MTTTTMMLITSYNVHKENQQCTMCTVRRVLGCSPWHSAHLFTYELSRVPAFAWPQIHSR